MRLLRRLIICKNANYEVGEIFSEISDLRWEGVLNQILARYMVWQCWFEECFPSLYSIALDNGSSLADYMFISSGFLLWFVRFIRAVPDWEVGDIAELYSVLYAALFYPVLYAPILRLEGKIVCFGFTREIRTFWLDPFMS